MDDEFYLQDSRGYVGNDILWWAKDSAGYTTDLSKAHIFSRDRALSQHNERETDIPWPKDYIDARTRPAVDMQYVRIDEALSGTGIILKKPKKPQKESYRCNQCHSFLSASTYYAGSCPRCGTENRP